VEAGERTSVQPLRVFTVVAPAGVAYRLGAQYEHKNVTVKGPDCHDMIFASECARGEGGIVFARCESGSGWVPLHKPASVGGTALLREVPQPGQVIHAILTLIHAIFMRIHAIFHAHSFDATIMRIHARPLWSWKILLSPL